MTRHELGLMDDSAGIGSDREVFVSLHFRAGKIVHALHAAETSAPGTRQYFVWGHAHWKIPSTFSFNFNFLPLL